MKKTSIFGKKWKKAAAPGLQSQSRHCCVSQYFPQSSVPIFDLKRDHLTYMWTSLVECLFLCFWKSTNKQEKPQQFLYYCNKIYYSLLRSDGLVYMCPIHTYKYLFQRNTYRYLPAQSDLFYSTSAKCCKCHLLGELLLGPDPSPIRYDSPL